jgi:hypothetical protein
LEFNAGGKPDGFLGIFSETGNVSATPALNTMPGRQVYIIIVIGRWERKIHEFSVSGSDFL